MLALDVLATQLRRAVLRHHFARDEAFHRGLDHNCSRVSSAIGVGSSLLLLLWGLTDRTWLTLPSW